MKIIISDIDMGDAEKTFMVSREYLARLVAMLEDGSPLPAAEQPRAADEVCCTCACNVGWIQHSDWEECTFCHRPRRKP